MQLGFLAFDSGGFIGNWLEFDRLLRIVVVGDGARATIVLVTWYHTHEDDQCCRLCKQ